MSAFEDINRSFWDTIKNVPKSVWNTVTSLPNNPVELNGGRLRAITPTPSPQQILPSPMPTMAPQPTAQPPMVMRQPTPPVSPMPTPTQVPQQSWWSRLWQRQPPKPDFSFDVNTPATPRPTAVPTPTPILPTQGRIPGPGEQSVPYQIKEGVNQFVPPNIAQVLMSAFEPIKAATESARVLAHPWSQTIPEWEQAQIKAAGGKVWNNGYAGGENRGFKTGREVDIQNPNGSIDRGLFRINSDTFAGWLKNPVSSQKMAALGITSYDDMLDPLKNALFARMLMEATPTASGEGRSWRKWWAAPLELRHPSLNKNLAENK